MLEASSERVSDAEREQAAGLLKGHLVAGRLTTEEFAERVGQAYGARVRADLSLALTDLPPDGSTALQVARPKGARVTGAVFSHIVRRGRRRLRGWTLAGSVLGDLDLDLRDAELERARTVVNLLVLFGNADVYVPDQLAVTTGGLALIGHQNDHGADIARPGAPSIHVRVLSLFGTVDVWRVPPSVRGDYGKIIEQVTLGERR